MDGISTDRCMRALCEGNGEEAEVGRWLELPACLGEARGSPIRRVCKGSLIDEESERSLARAAKVGAQNSMGYEPVISDIETEKVRRRFACWVI